MAPSDLILERLKTLHPKAIDLSLGRVERLLASLDHPEQRLPPVIHIAGTNGKGSLLAYLEAILRADGLRAQAYLSPHLVRFNERIRLDGAPIAEPLLVALLAETEAANAGLPITFFEITTAAAYLAFARQPADVLILEVGLGGRLDATNVIARPALTAITPISIDHQHYLGETLEEIAGEKAGILKPGVSAVIGPQVPAAGKVIDARAALLGCPLLRHGVEWTARREADLLIFEAQGARREFPLPILFGAHQIDNAGTAIACAKALTRFAPSDRAIAAGLRQAVWPGRLQRLTRGPLLAHLPRTCELWLDGGHNPAAGQALARVAEDWGRPPLHLVVGMLNTKPPDEFLRPLAPHIASLQAVAIPGEPNSLAPEAVRDAAARLGIDSAVAASVEAALKGIVMRAKPPFRLLICGSLYLIGHVLAEHG